MTTVMAPGATARGATRPALDRRGGVAKPVLDGRRPPGESALVYFFTLVPMLALVAAVPLAWGWGLSWLDVGLAVGFYLLSGLGVTVGFHRYFTHRGVQGQPRPAQRARDRRQHWRCRAT